MSIAAVQATPTSQGLRRAPGQGMAMTYHAFKGPTGEQPSGSWTVYGAHPSQADNDLIAGLLAELDIWAIDP